MPGKKLAPVHPGEILAQEFLKPLSLTEYRLAKGLRVSARRINEIVHDLEVEADRLGSKLVRDVEVLRRTG